MSHLQDIERSIEDHWAVIKATVPVDQELATVRAALASAQRRAYQLEQQVARLEAELKQLTQNGKTC